MEMLKLALKSRLPLIHVKTDDILHVGQILTFLAGAEVTPLASVDDVDSSESHLFFTSAECTSPGLYQKCKNLKKTIVLVNTKDSVLHFKAGVLVPPREMLLDELQTYVDTEEQAAGLLSAFGGLTLKETFEVVKLTLERCKNLSVIEVNKTRQGMQGKLKGIQQVDTGQDYYRCPSYLEVWLKKNAPFFADPVCAELAPRGLLYDGPPGTGKTSGAKFVANAFGVPLYRLDVGGLKGKYVGQSEEALLAALNQADQMAPCVLLLDEVEKLFGEQSDSGVTASLLGSLLWWLQEHQSRVFTIMTTNDRKKIPKELYREGRINDVMTFKGLESVKDAMAFAVSVFNVLAGKVWPQTYPPGTNADLSLGELASLKGKIETGDMPVPQSRVTVWVQELVKTMVLGEQDQANKENEA